MSNPFFKNRGPFLVRDIVKFLDIKTESVKPNIELKDIKD